MPVRHFFGWWAAGGALIVLLLSSLNASAPDGGWVGNLGLVVDGSTTTAQVVSTNPEQHCRVDYVFQVAGEEYQGAGAECGTRRGETIDVTYLPANPHRSRIGSALRALVGDVAGMALFALLAPPIVIWRIQRWRQSSEPA